MEKWKLPAWPVGDEGADFDGFFVPGWSDDDGCEFTGWVTAEGVRRPKWVKCAAPGCVRMVPDDGFGAGHCAPCVERAQREARVWVVGRAFDQAADGARAAERAAAVGRAVDGAAAPEAAPDGISEKTDRPPCK